MDRGGRAIGMVIFILGIVILLFVFAMAYAMFTAPASQVFGATPNATATGLGSALALMLIRIGLLFIMTLAGSLIAARGIHLYLGSAERRRDE
jgi:hypothetical protein